MRLLWVSISEISDSPRNFWLAQLGEHGDAPCGSGQTVAEALENLAGSLRSAALLLVDDVIERVADGEPLNSIFGEKP